MIEELKKALADYVYINKKEVLQFTDQGDTVKVEIVKFIYDHHVFDAINEILLTKYNAKYSPYVKQPHQNAYYIIPKASIPKQNPQPSKLWPKLPESATVQVSYARKVTTPNQYEMMTVSAGIEAPAKSMSMEEAYLYVMDFVEAKILMRQQQLEASQK